MRFHQEFEKKLYRCWLYAGRAHSTIFKLEASLLCGLIGLKVDADDEDWTLFFGIGLFSLFVSIPGPRWSRPKQAMTTGIRVHNGAIWWDVWHTRDEWRSSTPRWRHGNFNPVDFFFGRRECTHTLIEQRNIVVPMPEKTYPATAKLELWTWKRPRWFFAEQFRRVSIDIPGGIPLPGKGTSSWNCGDDATFAITTGKCDSIAEGVGVLVGSVLRDRVRYGGWGDWLWRREEAAEVAT